MQLSFGEKIRNLREDMDINQSKLGTAVNMTQRKISYIECGKYEPSLDDIKAFCHFFGVSADYLLDIPENYLISKQKENSPANRQGCSWWTITDSNR